jgi:hypothetical protein
LAKFRYHKTNLNAGELSPRALARTDLPIHAQGARTMKNWIPNSVSGAFVRPGSEHVATVSSELTQAKLIPFVFSKTASGCVEIKDGAMRVHEVKDSGLGSATTITHAVTKDASASWYSSTDLPLLQYAQSADVIWIVCGTKKPQLLIRLSVSGVTTGFVLESFDKTAWATYPLRSAPYAGILTAMPFRKNMTGVRIGSSLVTNGATGNLTCDDLTKQWEVGTYIKFWAAGSTTTGLYVVVQAGVGNGSPSGARITSLSGVTSALNTLSADWEESAWSSTYGYPKAVCFYQDRLVMMGSESEPDTLWFSRTSNYFDFNNFPFVQNGTVTADLGFDVTINSQQVNKIQWAVSGRKITVGTLGREYIVGPAGDGILSAGSVEIRPETSVGGENVQAVQQDSSAVFVARGGLLREIAYDFQRDSYVSEDLGVHSERIALRRIDGDTEAGRISYLSPFYGQIHQIAAMSNPHPILWCATRKGGLIGLTRDRKLGVAAWHWHTLGGEWLDPDTDDLSEEEIVLAPYVHSVCTLPDPINGTDDLYLCVTRTINGSDVTTIERISFASEMAGFLGARVPRQMDLHLPAPTGLSLFNGSEVSVVAYYVDGETNYLGEFTVSGGGVSPGSVDGSPQLKAGYKFTAELELPSPEAGAATGSGYGAIKRIDQAYIEFIDAQYAKVGSNDSNLEAVLDEPSLTTAARVMSFPGSPDREGGVKVVVDVPMACGIASITLRGVTNE